MFLFGYWQIGNRQIFFNDADPKVSSSLKVDPDHPLVDFKTANQTVVAFIILVVLLVISFSGGFVFRALARMGILRSVSQLNADLDVDEDLPNYFQALPGMEQKSWYANEIYLRNRLGFKTISDA